MSEFWNNPQEVSTAILGMFDKTFEDPAIKEKAEGLKNLLVFNYTDPALTIWLDSRGGKLVYGDGTPPGPADVQMNLSADDAHRTWSNKMNVMVSIAKKKIVLVGNATRVLKLIPLLRIMAENYNKKLEEMGKGSIVLR
jgi:alkyl sulfatase BDS1-like metallo-beta-lactamase superfamily hydrolase